ncbi:pyridoxal-phosphate dependent enzyme [Colletotrichum caudatum]|nr:pyridoxal-phosphate dependent enzyme [Colletotrichum caudatum]
MADLSTCPPLTRASVVEAHKVVRPHVHYTPVLTNKTLTALASTPRSADDLGGTRWEGREPARPVLRLWFKCENLQRVGAFKVRGAFHAVERLKREPGWLEGGGRDKGVVTHSSGNHAQALALAARESGIPAHIVMPDISPPNKIAATRGYGANVVFSGSTSAEREAVADRVVAETGARLVPPYDHPDIMLGQGTMGLELQEQVRDLMAAGHSAERPTFNSTGLPPASSSSSSSSSSAAAAPRGLNAVMTPCGGGGMLSGVALSCEGTGIRVFGAEPEFEGADDCRRGLEAGRRVEAVRSLTVADGLRTPVGRHPWSVIHDRRLVAGVFAASEAEIVAATRLVLERFKLVVEPSGAVPLAVALFNEDFRAMVEREAGEAGWDLGLVFSGGNVAVEGLLKMFAAA